MAMADNIVITEMTWTEVDEAMKDRPVGIVPVGATEAHGPHLPVSADTVIAMEMARRGAAKLKERGIPCLILPPVNFTVAEFSTDFSGTISIPAETATALIRDVCVYASKKFRAVALVNIHLEPSTSRASRRRSRRPASRERASASSTSRRSAGRSRWARRSCWATMPAPGRPR